MSEKWTQDQLDAIQTTDKAVIVSAAAGSGKTAVLIERTIRLLADEENQIPANKLLAVTFTNDAAAQMREKLSNALAKKIEENPLNEWLQIQQVKLQMAKITTINAFCLDLVKNNIHQFDITNGIRILDETETEVMLSTALDTVLEKQYKENAERMQVLNDAFCDGNDSKLVEIIRQLFKFSRALPFKNRWFAEKINAFDSDKTMQFEWREVILENTRKDFELCFNTIKEAFGIAKKLEFYSKTKAVIESDYLIGTEIDNLLKLGDIDKITSFISTMKWSTFSSACDKGVTAQSKEIEAAAVEYIKQLRDSYKEIIKEIIKYYTYNQAQIIEDLAKSKELLSSLVDIVNELCDALWELKVNKNAIDFADVEIMSIELLAQETENSYEKTQLAQDIVDGKDFKVILIDEFQDVNNLQDIIFKMLSTSENPTIIGKNMFVVGDVKQSIYQFRQANPKIFIKTRRDSELVENKDSLKTILLKKNFRSRKCVIDFVNFVFDKIMSTELGGVSYDSTEMLDLGANYDDKEFTTEILIVEESFYEKIDTTEDSNEIDIIDEIEEISNDEYKTEALVVAKKISEMLENGYPVYENGEYRVCNQKDFCVLLRNKTSNKQYIKAFSTYGLKAQTEELNGYLRSREISILISMLQLLDNPMNDIALTAVLLSPIFMFNADEISELKSKRPNAKMYQILIYATKDKEEKDEKKESYPPITDNIELINKCKKTILQIKQLRFYSASLSLERLIRKIYDSTDFFSLASTFKDSAQKRANLRLLLEYANSYDNGVGGGLSGFIRYINSIFQSGGDLKQAGIVSQNSEAIVIKTIHKSKGLEFPFVFLCGTSTKFMQQKKDLAKEMLINLDYGIGFKIKNPKQLTKYKTLPYDAISIVNEKEMLSEEIRLLYVALTRAKERLFITYINDAKNIKKTNELAMRISKEKSVTPTIVKSANSMQDWLTMALLTHEDITYFNDNEIISDDIEIMKYSSNAKIEFVKSEATIGNEGIIDLKSPFLEIDVDEVHLNEMKNNIKKYINFKYDSLLSSTNSKLTVSEISKEESPLSFFPQAPKLRDEIGELTPAEKGTATHLFMELADFENVSIDVDSEIKRLVEKGAISNKQGKAININSIRAFFDSTFYQRIKNSISILKEKQFLVMISDLNLDNETLKQYNNTEGMLQGIADCLFEESDGYVLVDYKTDNVKIVEELIERYSKQLELYKASFDLILDKPVKSSYIYSFKLKQGIEIKL